jgi:hypothetical protein
LSIITILSGVISSLLFRMNDLLSECRPIYAERASVSVGFIDFNVLIDLKFSGEVERIYFLILFDMLVSFNFKFY